MGEQPDLVRLLYRADWTRLSLAAEVSVSQDPGPGARAGCWAGCRPRRRRDVAVVLAAGRVLGHALLRVARESEVLGEPPGCPANRPRESEGDRGRRRSGGASASPAGRAVGWPSGRWPRASRVPDRAGPPC